LSTIARVVTSWTAPASAIPGYWYIDMGTQFTLL
jgi:hypothetical protein